MNDLPYVLLAILVGGALGSLIGIVTVWEVYGRLPWSP